jgi:hypothetical protein
MKRLKTLFSMLIFISVISFGNAQEISQNAIGLRIGDGDGFGTEVSYQRALGENNRLEVDLGLRSGKNYDGFRLTGIYQWVWVLDGKFNWYAGVGGGVASYSYDDNFPGNGNNNFDDSQTFVYVAGQVGIEYNFDIPLVISIDTRPSLGFGNDFSDDLDLDIALGIRYQF